MEPGGPGQKEGENTPHSATWGSSGHSQQQRLSAVAAAAVNGRQQHGDESPASGKTCDSATQCKRAAHAVVAVSTRACRSQPHA